MPLDKQMQEEIRAIVASEIQDVLRGEMARWWAESVVALSRGTLNAPGNARLQNPPMGSGSNQPQLQAGESGAALSGGIAGRGDGPGLLWGVAPTSGAAPVLAADREGGRTSPQGAGSGAAGRRGHIRQRTAPDAEYLARVAESLERTQSEISREQQSSVKRLRAILEEAEETTQKLNDVLRTTTARATHADGRSRRR